ncbi:hypothetical protein CMV37_28875, partial [Bacillus cereus]
QMISLNIMWGDSGVANFFYKKRRLVKSRFFQCYFTNWDCY